MSASPFIHAHRKLSLRDIIGFCQEFKRYHQCWPRVTSTYIDFEEAGIQGLCGADLQAALRHAQNGLADDPEFQEMRRLAFRHGGWDISLSFINPEYCKQMPADYLVSTVASVTAFAPQSGSGMWVNLPLEWKVPARVHVAITDIVSSYIGEFGMIYGSDPQTIEREYYLSVIPNGRLYFQYHRILGSRYVGEITAEMLNSLRTRLEYEASCVAAAKPGQKVGPQIALSIEQELAKLEVHAGRVLLPGQILLHYAEIKRRLEDAGGRYVVGKKEFVFEPGIDCREILSRLVKGESINFQQEYQFFATPPDRAEEVVEEVRWTLGTLEGKRILEPSAGDGALADVARRYGAEVVTIEKWNVNAIKLRNKGYAVIERDFLSVTPEEIGLFDAVIANPPFAKGQDIEHVQHMFRFIKPGGAMSVIMSPGWVASNNRKHEQFREFLETQDVTMTRIEAGAFKTSGTEVPTLRLDFRNCNAQRNVFALDESDEIIEDEQGETDSAVPAM